MPSKMTESEAKVILESEYKFHGECSVFGEALTMAINALEKQIPKKPISVTSVENSMYVKCPTCKLTTVLYDGCVMEYCKNCGQAIDWSDTD